MSRINRISPPNKFRIIVENRTRTFYNRFGGGNVIDVLGINRKDWETKKTFCWEELKDAEDISPFIQSYTETPKILAPQNYLGSLLYLASNDPIDMEHWQDGSNFTIMYDSFRLDFEYSADQFSPFTKVLNSIGVWKLDMNDLAYDMALQKNSYGIKQKDFPNRLYREIIKQTETNRVRLFSPKNG